MSQSSPVQPSSRRRRWIWIALVVIVLAGIAWIVLKPQASSRMGRGPGGPGGPGGSASMMNMAVPVKAETARAQDIEIVLRALGTVTAYNTVTVRAKVSGELVKVAFTEGQMVKAGDLLAQVDPRPYQVALAQAQGQQQQNLAQLENARRDLQRYQTLFKQDSIARQQLDTQAALVRQYEGSVKSDQAAVDSAKLNLQYSSIIAPVSGRLGLRQIDQGNLVSSSDTNGVVVITQTQPISVLFTLPETQLPQVLEQMRAGKTLTVEAYDRADTKRIASGVLETVDNQIDVSTGTVKLKARFDNADEVLFPNQFVNVHLLVEKRSGVTAIPTAAVQQGSVGAFVFQVQADDTVAVKPLKLGAINGGWVAVNEGLVPGDRVVIEGTDRLRAGSKVQVTTSAVDGGNVPATGPAPANGSRRHSR